MPYIFADRDRAARIMRRYRRCRGWGQIVGPHGSGKSTLLAWLQRQIEASGKPVTRVSLHGQPGQRPVTVGDVHVLEPDTQLLVDGYEQLSWWRRYHLKRTCQRRGAGLVVTAHRSMGLPTLERTRITLGLAQAIVSGLLAADPDRHPRQPIRPDASCLVSKTELRERLKGHDGNMRETLFSLYDLYEQIGRKSGCDSGAYCVEEAC